MNNHLELLKTYQQWRRSEDATIGEFELNASAISEALDWAIHELQAPEWAKVGDGTLRGAIDFWQAEHAKEKQARQQAQQQLDELRHQWQRQDLCLSSALEGKKRGDEGDQPLLDRVRGLAAERDQFESRRSQQ